MSLALAAVAVGMALLGTEAAKAAPEEAAYGAPEYPTPALGEIIRQRFLVAAHSRADTIFTARTIEHRKRPLALADWQDN
ncbi:MAG: hypothetical protein HYR63_20515 [Proteobacteria bacterium]|nr:hypothetical protein [Pseudomonadota bacterium]MBI3497141.1 hypothetical protein [Pseudomonadota bacterium]